MQTKIATCCYCGTRAALVLKGVTKHELSCSACGAPLHDLKHMPIERKPSTKVKKQSAPYGYASKKKKKSKYKSKKRKSLFSEAFDLLEDIFD
ncbi:MAG: hypothetical protein P8L68_01405 [Paracoccaceae bacterium]|nr:hypothetical protein [Paracoccaceae bacterium]MDG2257135.1 hypothetical protein [Paracoccaceae bacterium]